MSGKMKTISKFESRKTSMKLRSIWGSVHASIGYANDEPSTLSLSEFRKDYNHVTEYSHHNLCLGKEDLQAFVDMLRENELVV